jgi:hypothetical protein
VPELGTPGSVRGVLSNGHPYRNPRPLTALPRRVVACHVALKCDSR